MPVETSPAMGHNGKPTMRSLFHLLLLLVFAAGCNYHSTYRPPADGRARPVWQKDKVVMYAPSTEPPVCKGGAVVGDEDPRSTPKGYWVPSDRSGGSDSSHHRSTNVIIVPVVAVNSRGHSHRSSSSSGGKSADGRVLVVMAVAAIIALPIITVGLALGHPEPEDEVADEIDRVNEYNDKARHASRVCGLTASAKGKAQ